MLFIVVVAVASFVLGLMLAGSIAAWLVCTTWMVRKPMALGAMI